jgi:putative endonuclease
MMGSASRRALYAGVTATLYERVFEHKNNLRGYFTTKYKCHRLVYFEQFERVEAAIARERRSRAGGERKRTGLLSQ